MKLNSEAKNKMFVTYLFIFIFTVYSLKFILVLPVIVTNMFSVVVILGGYFFCRAIRILWTASNSARSSPKSDVCPP